MSETKFKETQRIEVITSVQRRRRWSLAEKVRMVQECEQPGIFMGT
jgi:transposase